jgi:hypothetical protein
LALNMLLATLLGTMLAVGAALAWEFADRRVRDPLDLSEWAGVPVLAVLPDGRPRLVARTRALFKGRSAGLRANTSNALTGGLTPKGA